jgi:hypothetical protein
MDSGQRGSTALFRGQHSALIPDNLKTTVIRSDPYEPGLNPVLDDFGLEILEDRPGRALSVFSSQLPVSKWYQLIAGSIIADAICDRIVHTAHRIKLKGESVRKLYAHRGRESKEEPA